MNAPGQGSSEGAHPPATAELLADRVVEEGAAPLASPAAALRERVLRPRTVLSFLLALALLLVFILRTDIDIHQTWTNIRNADLRFIVLAALVHILVFFVRGYRWKIMLRRSVDSMQMGVQVPSTPRLTSIVVISGFVNSLAPAKLGDFYRTYLLKRESGLEYSAGFGSIVAERVYDLVVLFSLMTASALVAFRGQMPDEAVTALAIGLALLGLGLLALTGIWLVRGRLTHRIPERYQSQIDTFFEVIVVCLKQPLMPVLLTILIWGMDGVRLMLVARSVAVDLPYATALFVALMGALLTTIPFTPAGLGVVEVAMISVLKLVDVSPDLATSIAIIDRSITYWGVIVLGLALYLARHRQADSSEGVADSGCATTESSST